MKCLILLFVNLFMTGPESDSLVPSPDLTAFTHPLFFGFVHNPCECGGYNFDYVYQTLYDKPSETDSSCSVVPPNFEYGHTVTITGEQGDFFRIRFRGLSGDWSYEQQLAGKEFYVKKGTLGTWMYRVPSLAPEENSPVPLYEKPSATSKIRVWSGNVCAYILDIKGAWMYVETYDDKNEKALRGWLDPKMQHGYANGVP